ncbi:MAG: hypothetical protein WCJ33_04325, partial [Pseudomonadota bacterium]
MAQCDIDTISTMLPKIAALYEQALVGCKHNSTSTIKLITDTAQTLELLHIFVDGNCRAVITLWLNKELIRAGLSPAIFENPNDFDWKTTEELVCDITKGQD